mgnify:CR=1 FL=1
MYEEYTKRLNQVQVLCQDIIQLWAELGTPQAQTDSTIVKYYRDAPEQLGLHMEDLAGLKAKKERLIEEKRGRERRIAQLRATIEELWERLSVNPNEQKHFLASNRGCGLRTINEFEDELSRLNELKRQNLHIFVEEARIKLQELWDALYFSEEEMLDFTPAFSDVCSDALLSAHEAEILRLESLKEQRLPILTKIDRHRELVNERTELQQSSQDASRLMGRGQKGEKRDPGKLLREEKMRKRIAKELPKIEADLKATLEAYESEWGRPFLVHGERYLDELCAAAQKAPPPRSKTPSNMSMPSKQGTLTKSNSFVRARAGTIHGQAIQGQANHRQTLNEPPSRVKTPVSNNFGASTMRGNPFAQSVSAASGSKSPSKLPTRAPPKTMSSPERRPGTLCRADSTLSRPDSSYSTHSRGDSILSTASSMHSRADSQSSTLRRMGPPVAPPPRMKDLFVPPEPTETPKNRFEFNRGERSESIVRSIPPEDPYNGRFSQTMRPGYPASYALMPTPSLSSDSSRHISQASSTGSGQAGSENWETFSEQSDDTPESDIDFQNHRGSQTKRATPDYASTPRVIQGKKIRGIRSVDNSGMMMDQNGRMVRCSEAGWTDDGSVY